MALEESNGQTSRKFWIMVGRLNSSGQKISKDLKRIHDYDEIVRHQMKTELVHCLLRQSVVTPEKAGTSSE